MMSSVANRIREMGSKSKKAMVGWGWRLRRAVIYMKTTSITIDKYKVMAASLLSLTIIICTSIGGSHYLKSSM